MWCVECYEVEWSLGETKSLSFLIMFAFCPSAASLERKYIVRVQTFTALIKIFNYTIQGLTRTIFYFFIHFSLS